MPILFQHNLNLPLEVYNYGIANVCSLRKYITHVKIVKNNFVKCGFLSISVCPGFLKFIEFRNLSRSDNNNADFRSELGAESIYITRISH